MSFSENSSQGLSPGVKVILIGAVGNIVLSAIKFVGGVLGGSPALLNDAFHSLSDLTTDGVALLTYKIGRLPRDPNHPYGHGKAESIGAGFIGLCIVLAGISLAWVSWEFFQETGKGGHSLAGMFEGLSPLGVGKTSLEIAAGFAFLSIVINEALYRYTRRVGEQEKSPTLIANAWHHRSDAMSSVAALIGIGGAIAGFPLMDPLAGIVVALMIAKSGSDIIRSAVSDLMDTSLADEELKEILDTARETAGVLTLHEVRSRRVGGDVFIDLHVLVDAECSVSEGHQIGENLRQRLIHQFTQIEDVLVHIDTEEPSDVDPVYQTDSHQLKKLVSAELESFSNQILLTRLRPHFNNGDVTLEVFLRPHAELKPEQYGSLLKEIQDKLENLGEIKTARTFLDIQSP